MLATDRRNLIHTLLSLAALALALTLAALFLIALASGDGHAQHVRPAGLTTTPPAEGPVYTDYRGVRLGMTAQEVRAKLCPAVSESNEGDFHVVSETETAQVFYDSTLKVRAVVATYTADGPSAEALLGRAAETREDGSQHLKVSYDRAGYWVAYTRTAGESPTVTIAMQWTRK